MGFFWALLSVGLVSAAQLLLRSAMVALPPLTDIVAFLQHLLHFQPGTFGLFFGLLGYLLSMVCWYFALHRLPLSKAYALLSLSYILVWAAAIWLPGWHEPFYWQSLLGVAIIVAGVLTIFWPVKRRQPGSRLLGRPGPSRIASLLPPTVVSIQILQTLVNGTESSIPTGPSSQPQTNNDRNTTVVDIPSRWPIMRGSTMLPSTICTTRNSAPTNRHS